MKDGTTNEIRISGHGIKNFLQDILGAFAFITMLGLANSMASNAGNYAAPTQEEIDADIEAQRVDLCDADGWPDDENSRLAFRRACHTELQRSY
ncbi:hypothetical protein ACIPF8_18815 [Collimonas sp. NPDC087041]|uniref:hypothetical protein n=1 Tax=Collimonas sp. NPDC087041 TaxID=3363960 RepID=UPI0037F6A7A0